MPTLFILLIFSVFISSGCASTTIKVTGLIQKKPFCHAGKRLPTYIYWGPVWRKDQKEPLLREAAALRGINYFVDQNDCISVTKINRFSQGEQQLSAQELLSLSLETTPKSDRILSINVRELGPRLVIGLPVIIEGGTEVLIDIRVIDTRSSTTITDAKVLWRNGGMFVIKGVASLSSDLTSALNSALILNADNN